MELLNTMGAQSVVRPSRGALLEDLARIRGTTIVALLDKRGVCTDLVRTAKVCALGAYRVLCAVTEVAPGRSSLSLEVDGRTVLVRRLSDGTYALVVTSGDADAYQVEVLFVEAVSSYALRVSGSEPVTPTRRPPTTSMTIRPPASTNPSELPPIEASLVLAVGSLKDLYRDFALEAESAILAS